MPIPTSSINTCIFVFLKGVIRIILKTLYFVLYEDHHLYENNYLPITGYDEMARANLSLKEGCRGNYVFFTG